MAVEAKDIMFFFSANRTETDTGTEGGAVDKSEKVTFQDIGATTSPVQAFGEDTGDISISITVTGRDSTGALISEAITTHGTDARTGGAASTASFERIIKAVHAGAPTGALAVLTTAAGDQVSGTADAGGADYLDLEVADSQANDYYKGWVVRMTSGSAIGQLREVVKSTLINDRIYVRDWDATPAGTDTYVLYNGGMVFEHSGQTGAAATTILVVARPFYNVAADPDTTVTVYNKIFAFNINSTTTLSNATIEEDTSGDATLRSKIAFDLETSLNGSDSTVNRLTDPGGYTYDDGPNDVANSKNFSPNSGQGIWMQLSLSAGDSAQNAEYAFKVAGQTT